MPAVDECEGGAASAAGMIAMIGAGTVRPLPWMANGGRRGQVSAFGMKAVQRGAYSVHRGKCRPSGCGRSARTSPMLGTKPSTGGVGGEWWSTWTSFHVWNESRSEGRLFGPQGQMPLIGQRVVGVKAIRRKHPSTPQFPHSAGCCRFAEQWNALLTETARIHL